MDIGAITADISAVENNRSVGTMCFGIEKGIYHALDEMEKRNTLEFALMDIWEKAGVIEDMPETWTLSRNGSSSLKNLYFGLKEISLNPDHHHYIGAKKLCTDLWSYFEGLKYSFIFSENNREYDVMRMTLPKEELDMYKTRGLMAG